MMESSTEHNLAALLAHAARNWPELPAVAHGGRALHSYSDLGQRASRIAAALVNAGLRTGDRVALVSRNTPAYIEALFGCWWAGLVAVPVNAKLHPQELAFVLADSGARFAFVDDAWEVSLAAGSAPERVVRFGSRDYAALVANVSAAEIAAVDRVAPAWLFYTSGTTGRPKGVIISHANLRAMIECFLADVEAVAPGDAILHAAPMSHGSGLYILPHVARGAVNVVPESGGFDASEIVALLRRWEGALLFAAPTMVKRLVAAPELGNARLDRLKCIVYGGGPMYVEDCKRAMAVLGNKLVQIYGQGESPMTITALAKARHAETGRAPISIAASEDASHRDRVAPIRSP